MSAIPRFILNYKFDPKLMLHMDWMSEEDSGPEGILECKDEEERQVQVSGWRKDMLTKLGFNGTPEDHDDIALLEVVEPMWRTEYVSISFGYIYWCI
jgi:hypothetical protein